MPTNYGLPYMGSKNRIAAKVINALPAAKHLYDMFAGGCAITHAAALSGKFEHIHFNDLNGSVTQLFLDAVNGKYANETRWINRETFFALKDTDPYVSICWSFGNDERAYMYGVHLETWKRAYWNAVVHGDYSEFEAIGIRIPQHCRTRAGVRTYIRTHHEQCKQTYIRYMGDYGEKMQSLQRLQRLERLQMLQRLQRLFELPSLERSVLSYEQLQIEPDSVIYCDPPYKDTHGYISGAFDHEAFYEWCIKQTAPVYISEYNMPEDRFRVVAEWGRICTMKGGASKVTEKLYTPIK